MKDSDMKKSLGESDVQEVKYDELKKAQAGLDDITKAASLSAFKLGLIRAVIKLKNHVAYFPLILTVISMMILTLAIRDHNESISALSYGTINAFFFFCDVLFSILSVLAYMNATSKKSGNAKKIWMSVLFYILMAIQLVIDFRYLRDIGIETNLVNDPIEYTYTIGQSVWWTYVHIAALFATVFFAALAPFVQPYFRKIKIRIK